ncbi:MAG TPA: aldo/keto reductase [Propionibacteriaceae bacterium]|nr:aldo/keto reductase [Propionibacteriaceae bacterium]
MRTRILNGTDVSLTEIGFGAAVIGNLYQKTSDEDAEEAIEAAWQAGIRYFDTAPHYGLGLSERRLGQALKGLPRGEFVVSSKVGRLLVPNPHPTGCDSEGFAVPDQLRRERDYSRDGVLRSIDATLASMHLDRLDVVFVHDPDDHWHEAVEEAIPTLAELRSQGVLRAFGVGMNRAPMLAQFLRETPVDVVMLAGRYTLLEQDALEDVLAAAAAVDKSVVAVGVFNSGILAQPRPGPGARYDYEDAAPEVIARANEIADICEQHGTSLPAAAIAFPLAHPCVVNVTLGMRSAAEVQRNIKLYNSRVPPAAWSDLRTAGLLRPDAPSPV